MRDETRKILGLPELRVAATCVRVPVMTTHSLAVHARFEGEVTVDRAHEILATAPGGRALRRSGGGGLPDPGGRGRARIPPGWAGCAGRWTTRCALELFVCGDNLRKGAALNSAADRRDGGGGVA